MDATVVFFAVALALGLPASVFLGSAFFVTVFATTLEVPTFFVAAVALAATGFFVMVAFVAFLVVAAGFFVIVLVALAAAGAAFVAGLAFYILAIR